MAQPLVKWAVEVTRLEDLPAEVVLEVFESSAEDGSPQHMVQVPITIVP